MYQRRVSAAQAQALHVVAAPAARQIAASAGALNSPAVRAQIYGSHAASLMPGTGPSSPDLGELIGYLAHKAEATGHPQDLANAVGAHAAAVGNGAVRGDHPITTVPTSEGGVAVTKGQVRTFYVNFYNQLAAQLHI